MSASNEPAPFADGLLAGKYQIIRHIGHGGMGDVFEGLHVLMERRVAIKLMHARWAATDPACLSRFQLEAKTSSCLNHANIMTVYDFGITDAGTAYLVMDYIDGEGFDDLLRRQQRLSVTAVVQIFSQACDALAHAHDKGIVHRDLKPSNIMLCRNEQGEQQVKIVDFGIAKFLPGRSKSMKFSPTASHIVGSPLYMSPEQCKGDANLDGRSDIYSLGCLLYQALTGKPPIAEDTVLSIIYAHINQLPIPFGIVAPELQLPAQLEAAVFKALSKDPSRRQQSMRELKQELRQAVAGWQHPDKQPIGPLIPPAVHAETSHSDIDGSQLVAHLHDLANFYITNGQTDRAEQYLGTAIQVLVDRYSVWDLRVAEAVKELADYYREAGRFKDAEPLYFDLLSIKRKALGSGHPDIPCLLLRVAEMSFNLADYDRAARYYMRCLKLSELIFGANDPALIPVLTGLASALRRRLACSESARAYLRALSLKELCFGPDHDELISTLVGLAVSYRLESKYAEAEAALRRALSIYDQSNSEDVGQAASVILLLAELHGAQGHNEEADRLYAQAVEIRAHDRANELEIASVYDVWAAHYMRQKRLQQAEEKFRRALSIKQKALGERHPKVAGALSVLASLYEAQNNIAAAEEFYRRAVDSAVGPATPTAPFKPLEP